MLCDHCGHNIFDFTVAWGDEKTIGLVCKKCGEECYPPEGYEWPLDLHNISAAPQTYNRLPASKAEPPHD